MKRSRSKKGTIPDEPKKVFNHAAVLKQLDIETCLSPQYKKVPELAILRLNKPLAESQ
jgi:hypothetical protein